MRDLHQEELGHVYGAGNYRGHSHHPRKDKCGRGSKRSKESCGSKYSKGSKCCA